MNSIERAKAASTRNGWINSVNKINTRGVERRRKRWNGKYGVLFPGIYLEYDPEEYLVSRVG